MTDATDPAVDAVPDAAAASPAVSASPGASTSPGPSQGADADLLGLIDRLAELLYRSDLTELEIESGGTGLILRKSVSGTTGGGAGTPGAQPSEASGGAGAPGAGAMHEPVVASVPSVKAPLTGIFYASPAPGSAPYVQVGGEVAVGQIIGLIEAMKLFNEIKSDLAGRVARVLPESGALVKAKQPLIEVEPL